MDILGKSLTQLKSDLSDKKVSPSELCKYFIQRSQKYNKDLNVYITIMGNDEGKSGGLLAGLPLSIKDNYCTYGVRTTASALVLDGFVPAYDATVISRLKKEGATFVGKTNMDAWAHGSSTETSDYGPTHNPWDTTRAPGGSSGGSAASVAAGLAPASMGSETAGSIRQPAAWCGIVGLKPTYGRVSRYGVVAMGSSFDCPGPMTNYTEDAALLLQAVAGHDPYDATSSSVAPDNYVEELKKKKRFTIGISDEYLEGVDSETKQNFEDTVEILEKLGHTVKKIKLISPSYSISVFTILQRAEVSSNLARYDGIRYGAGRAAFGEEAQKRIMLGTYTLSHGYYDAYYKKAQKVRALIIADFERVFKDVDLIFAPTSPVPALELGEFKKYPFFGEQMDILNEPAAAAGIPAINIPTGLTKSGLPIGMQIMGRHFAESDTLNLAYQFEQETKFFGMRERIIEKYKD